MLYKSTFTYLLYFLSSDPIGVGKKWEKKERKRKVKAATRKYSR